MKRIESLQELKAPFLLTIGNFDGVHLGHKQFLLEMKKKANDLGLLFVVLTFSPHPRLVLSEAYDFLLHSCDEKREHLSRIGVDYLWELPFTLEFSRLSPQDFLERYLTLLPLLKMVFVGHDFRFGTQKSGNHDVMKSFCEKKNIFFAAGHEFMTEGTPISSTLIRKAIKEGDIEKANRLLDRPYSLKGTIIKGFGRGRQLGFPTANLAYNENRLIPAKGVFFTKTIYDEKEYFSLTNVGLNPTFEGITKVSIETHLLDFDLDIYDKTISIAFLKFWRSEKKFQSISELMSQIQSDVESAKKYFSL